MVRLLHIKFKILLWPHFTFSGQQEKMEKNSAGAYSYREMENLFKSEVLLQLNKSVPNRDMCHKKHEASLRNNLAGFVKSFSW